MAIPKSYDCAEAWPSYVTSIIGQDLTWMVDAACRRPGNIVHAVAWTGTPGSQVPNRGGDLDLVRERALSVCRVCPVQWDCARFAIETGDVWNVCAVVPSDRMTITTKKVHAEDGTLVHLKRDWQPLLEMAIEARMSVARLVATLRAADAGEVYHVVIPSEHGFEDSDLADVQAP